jgi:hypothetical protein
MPGRRVFFSFHYEQDVWRATNVRNSGKLRRCAEPNSTRGAATSLSNHSGQTRCRAQQAGRPRLEAIAVAVDRYLRDLDRAPLAERTREAYGQHVGPPRVNARNPTACICRRLSRLASVR